MKLEGEGRLVRIFIGETDRWKGLPLYQAIVRRAREEGLAGATVLRGLEGFGAHSLIHTAKILRLSMDLPIVVEIVDTLDRIEKFLPVLDEMVREGDDYDREGPHHRVPARRDRCQKSKRSRPWRFLIPAAIPRSTYRSSWKVAPSV